MKYISCLLLLVLSVAFASETNDAGVDQKQMLRTVHGLNKSSRRKLSLWSSFMTALHCMPGPLGNPKACERQRNINNNNNNSNYNNNNANGANGSQDGSSRSWSNWYNGGSGVYEGNGAEDKQYNNAGVAAGASFPWALFALVGLASGGGFVAYQTSKDEEGVASAETLKQKIKGVFSRDGTVEPSIDDAEYQNSPEVAVAKTRSVSSRQIYA